MNLTYDNDLLEGVVFLEARRLEQTGQQRLAARYHAARSRLYDLADPDERAAAFFQFNLKWFREFAFEEAVRAHLKPFPLISARGTTLLLRQAVAKKEEGAELFVRPDAQNVVVALRGERFVAERATLDKFLRHELCHISDMLDPAFGYQPDLSLPESPPAEFNLLRDRYRVLWDITIDGRLKHGHERAQRQAEFYKAFSHLPEQRQQETFEQLWGGLRPTHPELLELARAVRVQARNIPGANCPLCKFPTFRWAGDEELTSPIIAAIQNHFPKWSPAHGACGRCAEMYRTRQLEQPATLFL